MPEENELRPNAAGKSFLTLAYNRFYDLSEEIMCDLFWEKEPAYRLSRIKDVFGVYAELLNYEPIKWVIEHLKKARPPLEAEIGSELFKFIRNIVTHFCLFEKWDDIWVNEQIINWHKEGQSADKFLKKYEGRQQVKYRFWEGNKKKMTYLSINFPDCYSKGEKIYLNGILSEKDGVKFSVILMKQILDTQVVS